ncbi:carbonic anhydrase [Virgisporangium aliadipatigenens]|uniref:Carbonic anhydrase n=1 Tax=Virgisporangium aliadipatigenens TaxID=741659 RepID=A0A8J3YK09_9ACTN|nr:carbonic anhydrase [Virgisporangium aliadipatigenens]GIJ45425.1 carbonic anhydrase [Virgisporangium aliadipatigenens]
MAPEPPAPAAVPSSTAVPVRETMPVSGPRPAPASPLTPLPAAGSPSVAQGALARLLAGNERFAAGASVHPHQDAARRNAVAGEQAPFAAVVGCSDSRLPAELIFDCGLGDLFVVRTAGHTIGRETLGSVEYAVTVLRVPLVLVLGHHACGAVRAACDLVAAGTPISRNLRAVVDAIVPHARAAAEVDDVVELHVAATVRRLSAAVAGERCAFHGMVYDLRTGRVASAIDTVRKGLLTL